MKTHLLLCVGLLVASTLFAQTEGPLSPATITTDALPGAKKTWKNIDNVSNSDNAYADFDIGGGTGNYSDYLIARDFGFSVPENVIITGIEVEVERSDAKLNMADYSVRIVKYGVVGLTEQSRGTNFSASDNYETFGSISDLWGESWTPAEINDRYFGVGIAVQENGGFGGSSGRIDHIRIRVHYSAGKTLPLRLISFSGIKKNNTVQLKWLTAEETDMSHFELQRSSDGRNYSTLTSIPGRNNATFTTYNYPDNNPIRGTSYYRLKMVGNNSNDVKYSSVITIQFTESTLFTLWPAIFKAGQMLNISNTRNENITIRFFNNSGQQVSVVRTVSTIVSTQSLLSQKGALIYKIENDDGSMAGSGRLFLE